MRKGLKFCLLSFHSYRSRVFYLAQVSTITTIPWRPSLYFRRSILESSSIWQVAGFQRACPSTNSG